MGGGAFQDHKRQAARNLIFGRPITNARWSGKCNAPESSVWNTMEHYGQFCAIYAIKRSKIKALTLLSGVIGIHPHRHMWQYAGQTNLVNSYE